MRQNLFKGVHVPLVPSPILPPMYCFCKPMNQYCTLYLSKLLILALMYLLYIPFSRYIYYRICRYDIRYTCVHFIYLTFVGKVPYIIFMHMYTSSSVLT